mgnify:CR=1 FL=1
MSLTRYFKPEQKVLLRRLDSSGPTEQFEALSAFVTEVGGSSLDLEFPYRSKEGKPYPFESGQSFELKTVSMGMGLKFRADFIDHRSGNRVRFSCSPNFQAFQQRPGARIDIRLGLRFSRGEGEISTLRRLWEKNVRLLHSGGKLKTLNDFRPCPVNLSAGGMRFTSTADMTLSDVCLVLINLEDDKPPICALAEVVWCSQEEGSDLITKGLQFLNILEEDRERIETFIKIDIRNKKREEGPKPVTI